MNSAQREILKKYGSDCICVDGTHGMNSYGFELTTLLVLDDMRQGFPCGFLISNRSDQYVLSIFFEYVREEVGKLTPKVFMSDMAESFFTAWISTMEQPEMRLFCSWHVDRAWRKNISKAKGKEKQAEVYKLIRTLMQERDITAFEIMVPAVMKQLNEDPDTIEFAIYFRENYLKNVKSWAYCYRINSGLNTNMHIERMHRTLKYIYLHGKNVKRLDKAIHALMTFIRDKLFDRLVVLTKGKETYFVQENICNCNCKLVCEECSACIHQYTCTCVDSSIKWNMCKHIHSICLLRRSQNEVFSSLHNDNGDRNSEDDLFIHTDEHCATEKDNIIEELAKKGNKQSTLTLETEKEKLTEEFTQLIRGIRSESEITVLKRHMTSLKATIAALLRSERRVRRGDYPVLQNTELGLIHAGRFQLNRTAEAPSQTAQTLFATSDNSLDHLVQRFWELKDISQPIRSKDDLECEKHFTANTRRDAEGRFTVRLPLREDSTELGDSLKMFR
ncbi:uncharacterized protein [Anabrus simplex]|uniref:uncharacterized protein n=1 Tax=Anabrus simplex TaxID=316456 RepID=UPI0035A3680D